MQPELYGIAIVPAILALVQVAKETGVPSRLAPIISLALGVAAGVALQFASSSPAAPLDGPTIVQGVVVGIGLGLGASGAFSAVNTFVEPKLTALASSIESLAPAAPSSAEDADPAASTPPAADPVPAA
jgi:hypothetical protein